MPQITIFHTSDIHNKLKKQDFEKLSQIKSTVPNALLFDSGDAIWSGNIYWRIGGESILRDMSRVPYDVMCVGNREYHMLKTGMDSKISCANYPILSANLRVKNDFKSKVVPSFDFVVEGIKMTVVGLTVPCVTEEMFVKNLAFYYFEKPLNTACKLFGNLKQNCDVLIALTHIGLNMDRVLAEKTDVDVILGGHTHTLTEKPEFVNDTYIIHSGCYGKFVHKITLDVVDGRITPACELISIKEA